MMLQPGVICPAVCFYDAGGYTLTFVISAADYLTVTDILLSFAHRFSFSSCHKKSASCDINSLLSQLADFLQTFFQRLQPSVGPLKFRRRVYSRHRKTKLYTALEVENIGRGYILSPNSDARTCASVLSALSLKSNCSSS